MNEFNEKTIHVLHIMSGFGGGISSFIKNKALGLKKQKVIFSVLTFDPVDNRFKRVIEETGGRIFYMPNPKKEGFRKFKSAVKLAYDSQPKSFIIHSHIQGYRVLPFYLISKSFNVSRFIIHAHADSDEIEKQTKEHRINQIINKKINVEYASCGIKASENIFGKSLVKENKIMHIPNSIDVNAFLKQMTEEERLLKRSELFGVQDEEVKIIGHIGRFHRKKNHKFMIEIIKKLQENHIKFLWLFIGSGDQEAEIKEIVKRENLEDFVLFLGRREDVPLLYQLMDIFVLPSLSEGLPTVAIESQASGTMSFLSDRITRESDLDLNLVKFISIESVNSWVNEISAFSYSNKSNPHQRKKVIIEKKFSNRESAELYKLFLLNQIDHYNI